MAEERQCCKDEDLHWDDWAKECVEKKTLKKRCKNVYEGKIKEDEKCGGYYCKPGDDKGNDPKLMLSAMHQPAEE